MCIELLASSSDLSQYPLSENSHSRLSIFFLQKHIHYKLYHISKEILLHIRALAFQLSVNIVAAKKVIHVTTVLKGVLYVSGGLIPSSNIRFLFLVLVVIIS